MERTRCCSFLRQTTATRSRWRPPIVAAKLAANAPESSETNVHSRSLAASRRSASVACRARWTTSVVRAPASAAEEPASRATRDETSARSPSPNVPVRGPDPGCVRWPCGPRCSPATLRSDPAEADRRSSRPATTAFPDATRWRRLRGTFRPRRETPHSPRSPMPKRESRARCRGSTPRRYECAPIWCGAGRLDTRRTPPRRAPKQHPGDGRPLEMLKRDLARRERRDGRELESCAKREQDQTDSRRRQTTGKDRRPGDTRTVRFVPLGIRK